MNFEMLASMSKEKAYDVVTALRGPDALCYGIAVGLRDVASDMKWIFTKRLRWMVGVEHISRPDKLIPVGTLLLAFSNLELSKTPPWWFHWRGHTVDALCAMRAFPHFLEEAKVLLDLLQAFDDYFMLGHTPNHKDFAGVLCTPSPEENE